MFDWADRFEFDSDSTFHPWTPIGFICFWIQRAGEVVPILRQMSASSIQRMKLIRILSGPELLNFRLKRDCIAGFIVGTRQFDSLSPVVPSTGRDIVTSIPQRYESIAWNLFFFCCCCLQKVFRKPSEGAGSTSGLGAFNSTQLWMLQCLCFGEFYP